MNHNENLNNSIQRHRQQQQQSMTENINNNQYQQQQQQQLMKKMKTFQAYLEPNCHRTYSCVHCRAHLANHDELISKSFQGSQGRAYLFNSVVNVQCGIAEERILLTGLHAVADIYCECCKTTLGWKYEHAFESSQKYKEGKYIIELAHMIKENGWEEENSGHNIMMNDYNNHHNQNYQQKSYFNNNNNHHHQYYHQNNQEQKNGHLNGDGSSSSSTTSSTTSSSSNGCGSNVDDNVGVGVGSSLSAAIAAAIPGSSNSPSHGILAASNNLEKRR
ncbi:yippee-like [Dermatophagoides pteronyssinus]|uniref:yippee-like n=1 Tax=Dermatophagoides pteronyssinus TaxID=6956 RepID=UPI003F67D8B9